MEDKIIHACSTQAKGRTERLFRTHRDRLVKEMRLLGISAIEEANLFPQEYLPVYKKSEWSPGEQGGSTSHPTKGYRLGQDFVYQNKTDGEE